MRTQNLHLPTRPSLHSLAGDSVFNEFNTISSAPTVFTDAPIAGAIRKSYPELYLNISPSHECDYLGYAAAGGATATPVDSEDSLPSNLTWKFYAPPARRLDGGSGVIANQVQFGKYLYTWEGHEFILYIIRGAEGLYPLQNSYLLGESKEITEACMLAACQYENALHEEIWVFDGGYWQKSQELWQSVQHASWDDVILEESMKKAIMGEVNKFYNSREKYARLKVPWKRGMIYYGPPGNGKTISIKATIHALYDRADSIPTLYVRSLESFQGPEYSISKIFGRARQLAPCFLVFEDLDSIVTDKVRSYFLNEVDGLESNDGILMIGSTNHLERLDPGIKNRPSRFDRKYLFPEPNLAERIQYCEYWRKKLTSTEDVKFPHRLCKAIADITDGFSFAYIQEAFVAALLVIAGQDEEFSSTVQDDNIILSVAQGYIREHEDKDLNQYVLWREIKKQVRILRRELEQDRPANLFSTLAEQ
ncbi:MAG: hypothetical protein Q9191_006311 [Dirinaria sp. TL-2023a]